MFKSANNNPGWKLCLRPCDKTVVPFYAQGIILLQGKGGEEV